MTKGIAGWRSLGLYVQFVSRKKLGLINDGIYSKTLIEEAYNNFIRDTGSNISFDNFRASISNYAMAKDGNGNYIYDETIAEAFHDFYLNGNNAKEASIYIFNTLKSKI